MRTPMAPHTRDYPPRVCANPDCKPAEAGGRHKPECKLIKGAQPKEFTPKTSWQLDCCEICRNRRNYLARPKPSKPVAEPEKKSDESIGDSPIHP